MVIIWRHQQQAIASAAWHRRSANQQQRRRGGIAKAARNRKTGIGMAWQYRVVAAKWRNRLAAAASGGVAHNSGGNGSGINRATLNAASLAATHLARARAARGGDAAHSRSAALGMAAKINGRKPAAAGGERRQSAA
jgi:hypothetical protein